MASPISTPFDRLDAHQGLGQQALQPAVPVHVAAESDRDAVADDLGHPAQGVADLGRGLDLGHHGRLGLGVEAPHLRLVDAREVGERSAGPWTWMTTGPIWTTWLTMPMPSSARKALLTAPAATRAAVSRAEARSRTSRASPNPYFCIPGRSA